jgi:hypothetical protein
VKVQAIPVDEEIERLAALGLYKPETDDLEDFELMESKQYVFHWPAFFCATEFRTSFGY